MYVNVYVYVYVYVCCLSVLELSLEKPACTHARHSDVSMCVLTVPWVCVCGGNELHR